MPIAAVPEYLGKDFSSASPGLRFGMFLPVWNLDGSVSVMERNKQPGYKQATALSDADRKRMEALLIRQAALAQPLQTSGQLLQLTANAIAPFTTGLGNEHPLENGFAFLNPYGLPYLPGSGIKGVLRRAANELSDGGWGDGHGWTAHAINILFGNLPDADPQRGTLSFWDVIPQIKGNSLRVEVMTPHQSHYLQGTEAPHDSGSPNPICFLTVPPGASFAFHIVCNTDRLQTLAPELLPTWKNLLQAAFKHAFNWLGFGAKTAVGYGAMRFDQKATERAETEANETQTKKEKDERLASLSAQSKAIESFADTCEKLQKSGGKHSQKNKGSGAFGDAIKLSKTARAEGSGWSAEDKAELAAAFLHWLPLVLDRFDQKEANADLKLKNLKGEA